MVAVPLTVTGAQLLALILNALHGLLRFYNKDYTELNVDGLFGLRIIEGQCRHIWISYESKLPEQVVSDLKNLSKTAGQIANKALPHTFASDPKYFTQFKLLLNIPYNIFRSTPRLSDDHLIWDDQIKLKNQRVIFSEKESDKCFSQLLAYAAEQTKNVVLEEDPLKKEKSEKTSVSKTNITNKCLSYMMGKRGFNKYHITHQILYVAISELVNVKGPAESFVKKSFGFKSLDDFVGEWCANVINEMYETYKTNAHMTLDVRSQDIFMEQVFTCGQFGFMDTAKREWLEAVLSWQDPTYGCYGRMEPDPSMVKPSPEQYNLNEIQSRKLKFEKIAQDTCASHASAVASGALTIFLRFLIDPGPKEWSHLRMDLQRTEYKVKIAASGQFRTYEYPNWVTSEEVSLWDVPPPKGSRLDLTLYFVLMLTIGFLYFTWRLFCKRRRQSLYPFSFKKL